MTDNILHVLSVIFFCDKFYLSAHEGKAKFLFNTDKFITHLKTTSR